MGIPTAISVVPSASFPDIDPALIRAALPMLINDGRRILREAIQSGLNEARSEALRAIGDAAFQTGELEGMVCAASRITGRGPRCREGWAIIALAWQGIGEGKRRWVVQPECTDNAAAVVGKLAKPRVNRRCAERES